MTATLNAIGPHPLSAKPVRRRGDACAPVSRWLLADALGGAVRLRETAEVGIAEVELTPAGQRDGLFGGLGPVVETFQWHGAEVSRLPEGAEVLATNPACGIQALRVGDYAYGLQFHCEMIDTTVSDWRAIPAYLASLNAALGEEAANQLEPAVNARLPAFNATARALNDNFMRIIGDAGSPRPILANAGT